MIPQVEKEYRAAKDRNARAITGLSMGGAESLYVGLNALDRFAWVGSFSAGGLSEDLAATFPTLDSKANSELHLLWIACGTDDRLIAANRKFREWLKSKDIRATEIERQALTVDGRWRRNLAVFASLLFQERLAEVDELIYLYYRVLANRRLALRRKYACARPTSCRICAFSASGAREFSLFADPTQKLHRNFLRRLAIQRG